MSGVTNAKAMFSNARSFNSDISGWDVDQIENSGSFFVSTKALSFGSQILEKWDLPVTKDISYMFAYAHTSFSGDLCTPSWLRTQSFEDNKLTAAFTEVPAKVICCDRGNYLVSELGAKSTTSFCAPCETGKFQEQDMFDQVTSCKACSIGQAIMNESATSRPCEKCVPGLYQDDHGDARSSWGCKTCGTGKFSLLGAPTCTLCAPGQFQDGEGFGSCKACPKGYAQKETGKPFCLPCIKGEFQGQAGQIVCEKCKMNEFSPKTKELNCTLCPAGESSLEESGACQKCTSGRFGAAKGAGCEDCIKGQYQNQPGQSSCNPIQPGWCGLNGADSTANSDQVACPAGRSGAGGGAECESCAVGKFTEGTGSSTCRDCPIGYAAESEGSTKCVSCGVGMFGGGVGAGCEECGKGQYQNQPGQSSCNPIQPGWCGLNGADSTANSNQVPCPAGKSGAGGGAECESCAVGKFTEETGSSTCQDCPIGYVAKSEGSTKCVSCGVGMFGPSQNNCTSCPAGWHRSSYHTHYTECVVCPQGKNIEQEGSSLCLECSAGKFGSVEKTCTECPGGWFRDPTAAGDDRTECSQCPKGWETGQKEKEGETGQKSGQAACAKCDAGQYGTSKGICTDCPAGKYQDGKGENDCKDCGMNTFSNKTGRKASAACLKCKDAHADNTKTTVTGVSNPNTGCVCAGENLNAAEGTEVYRGYYTLPTPRNVTSCPDAGVATEVCLDPSKNRKKLCEICPPGARCSDDGMHREDLTAIPGWWKPNSTTTTYTNCADHFDDNRWYSRSNGSEIEDTTVCDNPPNPECITYAELRCCRPVEISSGAGSTGNATLFVSVCKLIGGRVSDIDNAQCYEDPPLNNSREHQSYGGPACKACRNSSYTMSSAGICKWCPEGAQVGNLFVGFATIMFLLLLAFTKMFWSAHDKSKDKKKKRRRRRRRRADSHA